MNKFFLRVPMVVLFNIVLAGMCAAFGQENLSRRDLSSFSWRTTDSNQVKQQNWDKAAIAGFLDRITDAGPISASVGDFVFDDLDGDGQFELLATVDYSGRGFFNTLFVVSRDSDSFRNQAIEVWNMRSLKAGIRDLDNDGRDELIVRKQLTPYLGSQPQAIWTAVYALTKSEYVDRSTNFTAFYVNEVIPRLKQKPASLGNSTANGNDDVYRVELAKIERTINLNPVAGLQLALAWCQDPKPIRRIFAASILGDINDQTATEALQKLTSDANADVATSAHSIIIRKREGRK